MNSLLVPVLHVALFASLAVAAPLAVTIKTATLTPSAFTASTVGVNSGHSLHSSFEVYLRRLRVGGASRAISGAARANHALISPDCVIREWRQLEAFPKA